MVNYLLPFTDEKRAKWAHVDLTKVDEGDFGNAAVHYKKSIDVNPDYADSHLYLSKILISQKQYAKAIYHATKSLELEPTSYLSYTYRANAQFRSGNSDLAKSTLENIKMAMTRPARLISRLMSMLKSRKTKMCNQ